MEKGFMPNFFVKGGKLAPEVFYGQPLIFFSFST
jgi:hypothetical protein